MQFALNHVDHWAVTGSLKVNVQELQQLPHMQTIPMRMEAFEAANGEAIVRLKVSCAAILLVGMFRAPRAGDVMLARPKWRLVQTQRFQPLNHSIFV